MLINGMSMTQPYLELALLDSSHTLMSSSLVVFLGEFSCLSQCKLKCALHLWI